MSMLKVEGGQRLQRGGRTLNLAVRGVQYKQPTPIPLIENIGSSVTMVTGVAEDFGSF